MERSIGNFRIPAGSLTVFFVLAILLTCAIYDCFIIPLWMKWKGQPGFPDLQRIALGLILSTLGMAAAAVVEMKRLSVAKSVGGTTVEFLDGVARNRRVRENRRSRPVWGRNRIFRVLFLIYPGRGSGRVWVGFRQEIRLNRVKLSQNR
ncbi:hypothetical protein LXL04_030213 [Taraxacum kok-saghyz]